MKCLFLQDIADVARAGEIKEVRNGYARNYLLPQGMAVVATPAIVKQWQETRRAQERQDTKAKEQRAALAERLQGETIHLSARAGPRGRLYGSITAGHIAEALSAELSEPIERRAILLQEPLRAAGRFPVSVRLAPQLTVQITVVVEVQGGAPASSSEASAPTAAEPTSPADGD